MSKTIISSLAALLMITVLSGCRGGKKNLYPPPLAAPEMPRRSIEVNHTKLRVDVLETVDRTGMAGGVVDTGVTGGQFKLSHGHILALPSKAAASIVLQGDSRRRQDGASSGIGVVGVGGGALTQTLGASIQSILALSERFHVITDSSRDGCDLKIKSWVTAVARGAIRLEIIAESCDVGSAITAENGDVPFENASGQLAVERKGLVRLLKKLIRGLPDPEIIGAARVIARDGGYITINMGKSQGVKRGMKAFATTIGAAYEDPVSGNLLSNEIFLADLFVLSAAENTAQLLIVKEAADIFDDHSNVRVGDSIKFR